MKPIEVSDLVAFVELVEQQKGRFIKQLLNDLERKDGRISPELRKLLLDTINDYTRAVYKVIGYTIES